MVSAATRTATSGPAWDGWATAMTAYIFLRPTAPVSARFACRRSAAISASVGPSAIACSWRRASPSMQCTWRRVAHISPETRASLCASNAPAVSQCSTRPHTETAGMNLYVPLRWTVRSRDRAMDDRAIASALCASVPSQDLLGKLFQLRECRRFRLAIEPYYGRVRPGFCQGLEHRALGRCNIGQDCDRHGITTSFHR